MKNKYVIISGLAFNEKNDMEKLKDYANQGWILEDIVCGFFYKLKKAKPQNIVYSLDYKSNPNEEYFTTLAKAGWKLVVSIGNQMHIFSAQADTKPIYSDNKSQINKYAHIRNQTGRGSLYSLIIAIILIVFLSIPSIPIKSIFVIQILIVDLAILFFNFIPYLSYNFRINQIKKYGKYKNETINNKIIWKIYVFGGIILLIFGLFDLINKNLFSAAFFIIFGTYNIISGSTCYKKYKKSL